MKSLKAWGWNTFSATKVAGTALLFGILYVFLIPPFQSPDEPNHWLRAWNLSEAHWMPDKKEQRLGANLPLDLSVCIDSFQYLKNDYEARTGTRQIQQALAQPLDKNRRGFTDFANTAVYAPTGYLPQSLGIACARALGFSPLSTLYAARLFNLMCWCVLLFFAIRQAPFLKEGLATLALLPASLVIAASANADVITNGLCFWLITAAMAQKTGSKQFVAFCIICINKLITWPLSFLYWIFPAKNRWWIAGVGLVIALIWGQMAQQWFIPFDQYNPQYRDGQTLNEGVDPGAQLQYIGTHPIAFVQTALSSGIKAIPSSLAHFTGKFGWEKNYLPAGWLLLLWLAVLAAYSIEKPPYSRAKRGWFLLIITAYVAAFAVTMYTLWMAVGAPEISNWQGRYFVPLGPVFALLLANGRLAKHKTMVWRIIQFTLVAGNLAMIGAIVGRYW